MVICFSERPARPRSRQAEPKEEKLLQGDPGGRPGRRGPQVGMPAGAGEEQRLVLRPSGERERSTRCRGQAARDTEMKQANIELSRKDFQITRKKKKKKAFQVFHGLNACVFVNPDLFTQPPPACSPLGASIGAHHSTSAPTLQTGCVVKTLQIYLSLYIHTAFWVYITL